MRSPQGVELLLKGKRVKTGLKSPYTVPHYVGRVPFRARGENWEIMLPRRLRCLRAGEIILPKWPDDFAEMARTINQRRDRMKRGEDCPRYSGCGAADFTREKCPGLLSRQLHAE